MPPTTLSYKYLLYVPCFATEVHAYADNLLNFLLKWEGVIRVLYLGKGFLCRAVKLELWVVSP